MTKNYILNKVKRINIPQSEIFFDLKYHPKHENLIVSANIEGNILMVDLTAESNPVVLTLEKHHKGSAIRKVCLPNENTLVSAAKSVKLFDLNNGKVIRKIDNNNVKIYSLLIIDEHLLAFGDDEGSFHVYDYRVDRGVYMNLKQCQDYISDLDVDSSKRIVVASSGEGTLTAFNVRAKRMEEPQSELFDSGFQCVRYMEEKNRVIVGSEDAALNIFNIGEWGNISDRFPFKSAQSRVKGYCSVDNIELIDNDKLVACSSDGKIRLVNILPNKILFELKTPESSLEAITVNKDRNQLVFSENSSLYVYNIDQTEKTKDSEASSETPVNSFFSDM